MPANPEREAYHALATRTQSSYKELTRLWAKYGNWPAAWTDSPLRALYDAAAAYAELGRQGIRLILKNDPDYPARLKEISWAPFGIYVKGNLPVTNLPTLAIVGTRKATPEGKDLAERFATVLSQAGLGIMSGLAYGVDAASHMGALKEKGYALAVLAHGLERVYPAANAQLAKKILFAGGALISEYPPETPTLPYRFLERNRIVSGLADGVLVIEAPEKSGSLVTARFALEQNRNVFVLPGPVNHPNFKGSHQLIRAGAELVTSPEEILAVYGLSSAESDPAKSAATPDEAAILKILSATAEPISIDKLIELSKLRAQSVNQIITLLTLQQKIQEHAQGYSLK